MWDKALGEPTWISRLPFLDSLFCSSASRFALWTGVETIQAESVALQCLIARRGNHVSSLTAE
jgi:hypothetical protein